MLNVKRQNLQELNAARDDLWKRLDALDDSIEIYPGWKKREFFAHIAGWEAMVFEVIYRHLTHQEPKDYAYTDVDNANTRFVAVRQTTTVRDAKLECEINRFAILTLLEGIEDFNDTIHFSVGNDYDNRIYSGRG